MALRTSALLSVVLLLLLVLPNESFASMITSHDIEFDIADDGTAHTKVAIEYSELTTDKVYYLVFARISGLEAKDSSGALDCELESRSYGTQIACVPGADTAGPYSIDFEFDAQNLVTQRADSFIFSYNYGIQNPSEELTIRLLLPEGTGLVSAEDFFPYFPADAQIGSSFGRQVVIEWILESPELGKTYSFSANYEIIGGGVTSSGPFLYAIVIIVLLAMIVLLWRRSRKSSKAEDVRRVFSVLKGDEKKVIDVILEKGEGCKQRDIVKLTDFSKAKVSRIIVDLEERGIIEKVRKGRTNRIILKDETIKKAEKKKEDE